MITDNITIFLDSMFQHLSPLGIDVSELELDHIAYQTSSTSDYEEKKDEMADIAKLLNESEVENRRVAIYKLNTPITWNKYIIPVYEIVEPKEGQICESALNHLELVILESFETFMKRYSDINFNAKAANRIPFPKIELKFDDGTSIKFHRQNILDEIE